MADLTLSGDILYQVFMNLDSIDDCLHLARSCRMLYSIFDQYRLPILRSAILQSHAHQYDIQLCHFIDTYWAWASQYLQKSPAAEGHHLVECHYQPAVFTGCLKADTLSDQQVWDIVARWQGLAVLQDIYQHPYIFQSYCQSPMLDLDNTLSCRGGPVQMREILEQQPDVDVQQEASRCSPRQDEKIFPQLYLALTRYWLLCAAIRLAKICTYPRQSEENKVWGEIYAFCTSAVSLLEATQVLEAYDFTFDYLIRQLECAKVDKFTEWVESEDLYENETTESNWVIFLHYLRISLSPADVIELSILSHHWRQNSRETPGWSSDRKCHYLKERLIFGYGFPGRVWTRDARESPDMSYGVGELEWAVELILDARPAVPERPWRQIWQDYRRNRWGTDARGKALSWNLSDQQIADRLRGNCESSAPDSM